MKEIVTTSDIATRLFNHQSSAGETCRLQDHSHTAHVSLGQEDACTSASLRFEVRVLTCDNA